MIKKFNLLTLIMFLLDGLHENAYVYSTLTESVVIIIERNHRYVDARCRVNLFESCVFEDGWFLVDKQTNN